MAMSTRVGLKDCLSLALRRIGCNGGRWLLLLIGIGGWGVATAGTAIVEYVVLEERKGAWTAHVTVRHADEGWDHYADAWRITDPERKVLGTRTLYHPHETEQPFTRSLSGVSIAPSIPWVEVQAHDKVHGWGEGVRIDLGEAEGPRFRVRRP